MLLCDILFHIFVLLNILSCGIIFFSKKTSSKPWSICRLMKGCFSQNLGPTEMVSHASSGEYLVHPQQLNIDFSKNLIHVTVNVFFHQPAFPIWRLVNWITFFFSNLPAIYQLIRERQFLQQTIASEDSPLAMYTVFRRKLVIHRVGVRRLHVQSGAYGSAVAVAFLCLKIRSKNLVDIAWLQLLVVETCVPWPCTNQSYMKCLLRFEHKD